MRAFIVDDEAPARRIIRTYLEDFPDVSVVGEAADGLSALELVPALRPDLLFLDIQMPGADGFEVLEKLGEQGPLPGIVFSTAYDQHAVRAFEVRAIDYLLKPFDRVRFREAVRRVLETVPRGRSRASSAPQRILVREGAATIPVALDEVVWIEAAGDYAKVHVDGRAHLATRPLGHLAEELDPASFLRVHRSAVIRVEAIARVRSDGSGGLFATMADGAEVRVSRKHARELRARMR